MILVTLALVACSPTPTAPPTAAEPVDCSAWPDTVAIPSGPFVMGDDEGDLDERPAHEVWITGYCLDRRERPTPAVLDWAEAEALCASIGGRLPSEAEWEKAARGGCEFGTDPAHCDGGDRRRYPWGDEQPTCDRASFRGRDLGAGQLGPCEIGASTQDPIGGASPYGALGMAGSRMEWVADWYSPWVYGGSRRDPGGAASGDTRVLRGGAWNTWSANLRVSARLSGVLPGSATGVRCAFGGAAAREVEHPVAPAGQQICGEVHRGPGALASGGALVVTAFAEADLAGGQLPRPGASPAAELGLGEVGETAEFCLGVGPGRYRIMAALSLPDAQARGADPVASLGGVGEVGPVAGGATVRLVLGPPPTSLERGP